jgi:GAF domain-containing protein
MRAPNSPRGRKRKGRLVPVRPTLSGDTNDQLGNRRQRADPKSADWLYAAERQTLRMITEGASLTDILTHVCTTIDRQISPSITTILLIDPDGQKLWPTAGPKVPSEWMRAISPLPVAPHVGLCGTAASTKIRVIVPDVATEPVWFAYRELALKHSIRAGWSQPIVTNDNVVLGTFAVYSPESRVPTMPMSL